MIENNETCIELNEIIYQISGEFWKRAYNKLLLNQHNYEHDQSLTVLQSFSELKKLAKEIAAENSFKYKGFTYKENYYISLGPAPIYICIEKKTGDFFVSVPHLKTKTFTHSEYLAGIKWIKGYVDIDVNPLVRRTELVREKFYLNEKTFKIVMSSIQALCETFLETRCLKYKLRQSHLKSNITIVSKDRKVYEVVVYHKAFSKDSSILINLFNNLEEKEIEDALNCYELEFTENEIQEFIDGAETVLEEAI